MILIENQDQKTLDLLLLFLKIRNNNNISIYSLSKALKIDKSTVKAKVNKLIDDVSKVNYSKNCEISWQNSGKISVNIAPEFDENLLIAHYSKQSILFRLVMNILTNDFVSIEDFSKKNYVSISTVYQKLPRLKKMLKSFNISLALKQKSRFNGSERQIRLFYFYLLIDIDKYSVLPFTVKIQNTFMLDSFQRLWLTISHLRLVAGNYYSTPDELDSINSFPISRKKFQLLFKDELTIFFNPFHISNEIIDKEISLLYLCFSSMYGTIADYQELSSKNNLITSFDSLETPIEKLSYEWVNLFSQFFSLDLSEKDFIYVYSLVLNRHVVSQLAFDTGGWFYRNSDYQDLVNRNFYLSKKTNEFIEFIQQNLTLKIKFDHSLIFSYTFMINQLIERFVAPVKIYLYSKYGDLNTMFLKKTIKTITSTPISFMNRITTKTEVLISDVTDIFDNHFINIRIHTMPYLTELDLVKKTIEKIYYTR